MIPIPFGRKRTVRAQGAVLRRILCAHCGAEYFYVLERAATGTAHSVLFLENARAKRVAENRAWAQLQARLEADGEPLACPLCGHYPPELMGTLRAKRGYWLRVIGGVGTLIQFLGVVPLNVSVSPTYREGFLAAFEGPQGYVAAISVTLLAIGIRRRATYDPNALADQRAGHREIGEKGPFLRSEIEARLGRPVGDDDRQPLTDTMLTEEWALATI